MKNTATFALIPLFLLLALYGNAQIYQLDSLTALAVTVPESSGLLYKDGRLITHNDSGNDPYLYELDTLNGQVLREVFLQNANNVDWEDITADANYLYVGDIGNNYGNRTDLLIYKVAWSEFLTRDTVEAQQIIYAYTDQVDFSNNQFFTPYDAEALVAIGDSLFLFTKDWTTAHTKVYPLPKMPGTYAAVAIDSFAVPGLITGVDLSPDGTRLLFSAYAGTAAFVLTLSDFTAFPSSGTTSYTWPLPLIGSLKSEGVCWRDNRFAYLSTEQVGALPSVLYRLDTDFVSKTNTLLENRSIKIYPQPTKDIFRVEAEQIQCLQLFDANGRLLIETKEAYLDVSHLPAGIYSLMIQLEGQVAVKQVVVL
jgi:hypothetical protein